MPLAEKLGVLHIRCWRERRHNATVPFRGITKRTEELECEGCRVGVVQGPYTAKRLENAGYIVKRARD